MIRLIVICAFLLTSVNAFALESKYIACIQCNYQDAESLARAKGLNNSGITNSSNYVVFDPVSLDVWTFYSERYFESEIGRWIIIFNQLPNEPDDIVAVQAYNDMLEKMYDSFGGEKYQNESIIDIYENSSSSTPSSSVSKQEFIYNVVKGNSVFPLNFPSYSWMQQGTNSNLVVAKLAEAMALTSLSTSISIGVKSRLLDIIAALPLQFTVLFENGDTVTFVFDCLCSIPFIALHETASDKDGNKLSSQSHSTGSSSGGSGLGYDSFYDRVNELGARLVRLCTTVNTGPEGDTTKSEACWYVYL